MLIQLRLIDGSDGFDGRTVRCCWLGGGCRDPARGTCERTQQYNNGIVLGFLLLKLQSPHPGTEQTS